MRSPKISAVVPAFNEAKNISRFLPELHHYLEEHTQQFEVLVIDDGSRDQTSEAIHQTIVDCKLNATAVKVIRHPQNLGYGGALRSGFYSARFDWILLYPGDAQFKIGEIELLIKAMKKMGGKGPAIVWGYRKWRAEGLVRRFFQRHYRKLILRRLGVEVRDIDCGFKLYHRQVFYNIPQLKSDGALIDAEILYHCRRQGIPIREVGVSHLKRLRGRSTGLSIRVIRKMFAELEALQRHFDNMK